MSCLIYINTFWIKLNFHEQFGHPGSWSLKHPLNIAKDTRRWSPEVSKAAISALCRRIWWWIHSLLKNKGSKQTCSKGKILVISREQYCELMEECKNWTLLEVFQDILRFKGSLFDRLIQRTYISNFCFRAILLGHGYVSNLPQKLAHTETLCCIADCCILSAGQITHTVTIEERTFTPQSVLRNFK